MFFALEERQPEGWINVGYAEFDNFQLALNDAKIIAEINDIPWDDMRIVVIDSIPMDDIDTCPEGHPLRFTNRESERYCETCDEFFDCEDYDD